MDCAARKLTFDPQETFRRVDSHFPLGEIFDCDLSDAYVLAIGEATEHKYALYGQVIMFRNALLPKKFRAFFT